MGSLFVPSGRNKNIAEFHYLATLTSKFPGYEKADLLLNGGADSAGGSLLYEIA